jgi:hypothetical protein
MGQCGAGPACRQSEGTAPSVAQGENHQPTVQESEGDEQALYILLASSGMRISEALAIERRNFTNDGCTIQVRQQVHREKPLIVSYLKADAAYRDIDLHPEVAEYLRVRQGWLAVQDPERHAAPAQQH